MVLSFSPEEAVKVGDLVYPFFKEEPLATVGIYLGDFKIWTYGTECKIFWNGQVVVILKHQLKLAHAS